MEHAFEHFIFHDSTFEPDTGIATFRYSFDSELFFEEQLVFLKPTQEYDPALFRRALDLCLVTLGISYYKCFPGAVPVVESLSLDEHQAAFFTELYRQGLGEFLYRNRLGFDLIPAFPAAGVHDRHEMSALREGILLMQSGGMDSVLAATLLTKNNRNFTGWYVSSTDHHPKVVDEIAGQPLVVKRLIDREGLNRADSLGAYNGHVPFSAILAALATVQAVLSGHNLIAAANESSADEATTVVEDFEVNHQYSKTFAFEQAFQDYLHRSVHPGLNYVSLLRPFTSLRVAELFAKYCWQEYRTKFSSCNVFNYKQGHDPSELGWCGECPKCANTFLLLAPFVPKEELSALFGGQNLLAKPQLHATYKQLLGVAGEKPFECVATVEELQVAYHLSNDKDGDYTLPFTVENPRIDWRTTGDYQPLLDQLIELNRL